MNNHVNNQIVILEFDHIILYYNLMRSHVRLDRKS